MRLLAFLQERPSRRPVQAPPGGAPDAGRARARRREGRVGRNAGARVKGGVAVLFGLSAPVLCVIDGVERQLPALRGGPTARAHYAAALRRGGDCRSFAYPSPICFG